MKIRHAIVLALLTVLLSASTSTWAGGEKGNNGVRNRCRGNSCGGIIKAPEIDAASGILPLTLLSGVILLLKERGRSRRTPDSKKQAESE